MSSNPGAGSDSNTGTNENAITKPTTKAGTEPKKRGPKETKKTPSKAKGPSLDLDRQCGVVGTDGAVCTRVITCKAHSLAQKRIVVGRSKSFQELLQAHQANNSRARAKSRKAPPDQSTESKTKKKTANTQKIQSEPLSKEENLGEESSDFDSEVELDLILKAIRNSVSHPVATYETPSLKRKYQMMRCQLLLNPSYSEDVEVLSKMDSCSEPEAPLNLPSEQD